jgi:hypothetical protein
MARLTKFMLIGSVAVGIAACDKEAGLFLDEGGFGTPTMHNTLAQICSGYGKGSKAGAMGDPVVVLDPSRSSPGNPVYYQDKVGCSGQLNGKYAEVIFREYVNSAAPIPVGNELADIEIE